MKNVFVAIALLVVSVVLLPGCKRMDRTLDWAQRKVFGPSPKELVQMAFDPNDADRRREGITRLSKKDWGLGEKYLKGYALLLQTDEDASVRCAAARALGRAGNPKYLPNLVTALRKDPSDAVRWDAAAALADVTDPPAAHALQAAALGDSSADVRAASVKALRNVRDREVLRTMIRCLDDASFTVRYQAHASLVEMTGEDFGYESADWSSATGMELLPVPARPAKTRAWWDWFNVKGRPKKVPATQPATGDVE